MGRVLWKMGGPNNPKDSRALIGFRLSSPTRPIVATSRYVLGTFDIAPDENLTEFAVWFFASPFVSDLETSKKP